MKRLILISTMFILTINSTIGAIVYVNINASGTSTGNNWTNAFTDLNDALDVVSSGDEIWVAAGTYKPAILDQDASFDIGHGVLVFGGFDGTETSRSQRDWNKNETILSGEVGFIQTPVDNSYSIVRFEEAGFEGVLDGFIIRDAVSDQSSTTPYAAVVVSSASCRISHCIFTNNQALDASALLITGESNVTVSNCLFHDNLVSDGGTISQVDGVGSYSLDIIHCTFSDNNHELSTPELLLEDLHFEIRNSVLWGNNNVTSQLSPGLDLDGALSNSIVEGLSIPADQVIDADPAFNNIANADFRPSVGTSSQDIGTDVVSLAVRDLRGNPRVVGAETDAGCFEYKGQRIIHVDTVVIGQGEDGDSWETAYSQISEAVDDAVSGDDLWVANGTYYATEDTDRLKYLELNGQVNLYGGFQGNETDFEDRNWRQNQTVFSGNLGSAFTLDDNSHKIFYIAPGSNCTIDGITVQSAIADGEEEFFQKGAAIHVGVGANLNLRNSIVHFNTAMMGGAAIEAEGQTLVENCTIKDHSGVDDVERLINTNADLRIRGSFFYNNDINSSMIKSTADLLLIDACTFVDNITGNFPINVEEASGNFQVRNGVFQNTGINPLLVPADAVIEFSYCVIDGYELEDGQIGDEVYFEPPYFLNEFEEDYRLCWASIGFDRGNTVGSEWTEDLNGTPRIANEGLDFGAFENDLERPVIRVDESAVGGAENGLEWDDAYTDLREALFTAPCGAEIWVAEGVYTPSPSDRIIAFQLLPNVSIYGGFGGFEDDRDERDWQIYSTILSGETGNTNTIQDNSYTVIRTTGTGNNVIDGLFIRDAYSEFADPSSGALVVTSRHARVSNVRFLNNQGYAVSALFDLSDDLVAENCLFTENGTNSGATLNVSIDTDLKLINSTFSLNTHTESFAGEIGGYVGSIVNIGNCIFYGNDNPEESVPPAHEVWNSIVEGGFAGGQNIIDADPLFVNPPSLNFRLSFGSPARNTGLNAIVSSDLDLDGKLRIRDGIVDMGCFEFISICPGDLNGDLVVNTSDLTLLLSAFNCSSNCAYDLNGDAVVNTGDLQIILTNYGNACGDN